MTPEEFHKLDIRHRALIIANRAGLVFSDENGTLDTGHFDQFWLLFCSELYDDIREEMRDDINRRMDLLEAERKKVPFVDRLWWLPLVLNLASISLIVISILSRR